MLAFTGTLLVELIVKILEGFFTGPYILKIIGYIILISMNLGMMFINFTINMYIIFINY